MKMKISPLHVVVGVFTAAATVAAVMYGAALQMAVAIGLGVIVGATNGIVGSAHKDEDDPVALYTVIASVVVLLASTVAICCWYVATTPTNEDSLTGAVRAAVVAGGSVGALAFACWAGYKLITYLRGD